MHRLQFFNVLPNAAYHFAVGDIAAWSGIKRVGNAFIMGQFAATNFVKLMLRNSFSTHNLSAHNQESDQHNTLAECPPMDPMMALGIGKNALVYQFGR